MSTVSNRVRGIAFLVCGAVAVGLIVYLLVNPLALAAFHPIPLILLLTLTAIIAISQARRSFGE